MDTRTIICYHGGCPDGFGGAYAAWKKFGDAAEYVPLKHGQVADIDVAGADLYFIDFCYPEETMRVFEQSAASLTVLDHHEGVREIVEAMPAFVFDAERSGASIAWEFFHPGVPLPRLLAFVEDDDLYRFTLADTRPVISYLSVQPFTFASWEETAAVLDHPEQSEPFLQKIRTYAEYFMLLAELAVEHAKLVRFEGHDVYFGTAHPFKPMKSVIGNLLAKKQGPFALVVSAHPNGYGVSIRGDGSINVAEIAQKYGGNGHPNSAGFLIPREGPFPWSLIDETPVD